MRDTTKRFTVTTTNWPDGLKRRLEVECAKLGMTLSEFFLNGTLKYFASKKPKGGSAK